MKMSLCARAACVLILAWIAAACGGSPSQPSPSVAVPTLLLPTDNAQIAFGAQPVTLVVKNAAGSSGGVATYTFEVATDAAFASKVQTKTNVSEDPSGQTSVALDPLAAGADYYWRARATRGTTTGQFSGAFKLSIGPGVNLNAPVAVAPLTGTATSLRPTLTVADVSRQGAIGAIVYRFEIADNSAFTPVAVSATVPETPSTTSFAPTADLTSGQTYYWRAIAIDQGSSVSSAPSVVQSFTVQTSAAAEIAAAEGVTLWPGAQPPGTPGHIVLGPGWDVRTLASFDGVTHLVPTLDELRVLDLLDRGMDPASAINWLKGAGYATDAAYYSNVQAIGFPYEYMAYVNGGWELVVRTGA
jgi:hypothetical protein